MGKHSKFAAWLHVVCGLFLSGLIISIWVLAATLEPLVSGTFIPELVATFGRPVALALLGLFAVELLGATAVILSNTWGRPVLTGISFLHVWAFPVGTCLAVYTVWALWFAQPVQLVAHAAGET